MQDIEHFNLKRHFSRTTKKLQKGGKFLVHWYKNYYEHTER